MQPDKIEIYENDNQKNNDDLFCKWVCNYTMEVSMKCLTSIACELS